MRAAGALTRSITVDGVRFVFETIPLWLVSDETCDDTFFTFTGNAVLSAGGRVYGRAGTC